MPEGICSEYPSVGPVEGPAAFFERLYSCFEKAQRGATGAIDRYFNIGGYLIRLHFAGPALTSRLTPALEHLSASPGEKPSLTIGIWDSASTGIQAPSPPWSSGDYITRGEVHGFNDGRIHTHYNLDANVLDMLDSARDLAVYWTGDAASLPFYESGAPLRTILHWWLREHGRQLVHAAAVGTPQGGVLLVGRGGSGKSTTALTCLDSELVYAGDDYCVLDTEAEPYVHSLYSSAKLNGNNIDQLPHLAFAVSNADRLDTEKALIYLQHHFPHKVVSGFPVRAVLLPRVTGGEATALSPASPMEALRALAPSTLFQLAGAGRSDFVAMSGFVRKVPCYHLELGTALGQIPGVILRLLKDGQRV